jgi:maltooligosyltrehalose synthase
VVAFARDDIIVAAPRLVRARLANGGIHLAGGNGRLLTGLPRRRFRSAIDDRTLTTAADGTLDLDDAFATLPLAVLVAIGEGA